MGQFLNTVHTSADSTPKSKSRSIASASASARARGFPPRPRPPPPLHFKRLRLQHARNLRSRTVSPKHVSALGLAPSRRPPFIAARARGVPGSDPLVKVAEVLQYDKAPEFEEEGGMADKKCATRCELCGGVAAVHCAADSAFLCLSCDAKVHSANFLASRHLRRRLDAEEDEDAQSGSKASSASSSCMSTADSATSKAAAAPAAVGRGRKPRRARAEVVLEGWAKRMGFAPGPARRRAAAAASALRALGRGVAAARVPLRVAMAAALWSEVQRWAGEAALLRRLEASAHVPARLVVTVASWMARAARRDAEEGWAECS